MAGFAAVAFVAVKAAVVAMIAAAAIGLTLPAATSTWRRSTALPRTGASVWNVILGLVVVTDPGTGWACVWGIREPTTARAGG